MNNSQKCPKCAGTSRREGHFVTCSVCKFQCTEKDFPLVAAAINLVIKHKSYEDYQGTDPTIIADMVNDITVAEKSALAALASTSR